MGVFIKALKLAESFQFKGDTLEDLHFVGGSGYGKFDKALYEKIWGTVSGYLNGKGYNEKHIDLDSLEKVLWMYPFTITTVSDGYLISFELHGCYYAYLAAVFGVKKGLETCKIPFNLDISSSRFRVSTFACETIDFSNMISMDTTIERLHFFRAQFSNFDISQRGNAPIEIERAIDMISDYQDFLST